MKNLKHCLGKKEVIKELIKDQQIVELVSTITGTVYKTNVRKLLNGASIEPALKENCDRLRALLRAKDYEVPAGDADFYTFVIYKLVKKILTHH